MKIAGLAFVFALFLVGINGLKILAVLPFASKSHFAIGHSIAKALAEAGHELTVVSPHPQKKPIKNYKDISTEEFIDVFFKSKLEVKALVSANFRKYFEFFFA